MIRLGSLTYLRWFPGGLLVFKEQFLQRKRIGNSRKEWARNNDCGSAEKGRCRSRASQGPNLATRRSRGPEVGVRPRSHHNIFFGFMNFLFIVDHKEALFLLLLPCRGAHFYHAYTWRRIWKCTFPKSRSPPNSPKSDNSQLSPPDIILSPPTLGLLRSSSSDPSKSAVQTV